jgi:uncharacterized LabA/DUF88 family protein
MKSSTPHQRIGVFVDVQNMFYSAYDCFRGRLNYKKLLESVVRDRQVVRAVAYAMRDGNNQASFFTMLREVGFELRTKEPRVRPDGSRKGGWDIGIAIDAVTMAPKLDTVVLVSGDGDFVDLVHALKARGVRVEVFAFERNVGRELREAADEFMPIGEDLIFREGVGEGEPIPAEEAPAPPPRREPVREPVREPAREPVREAVREPAREPVRETPRPIPGPVVREKPASPAARVISSFGAGLLNDEEPDEEPDTDAEDMEAAEDEDDEIEEVE